MVDLVVFGLGAPPSILGSGVGGHAVRLGSEQGLRVRAVARSPAKYESLFAALPGVELVQGDVTDRASVARCLGDGGVKACLFTVHATDRGASSRTVNSDGLALVGEECAKLGVKLIVISSCFVTPKHRFNPIRVLLNTCIKWNMMDARWEGEQRIRAMPNLEHYVIIRPGSLTDGKPLANAYKIGQGDKLAFAAQGIPKVDVGRIALAAARDEACDRVTFEVAASSSKEPATVVGLFTGLVKD